LKLRGKNKDAVVRFKACIFDLDGTLVNTLDDITSAMNRALSLYGYPGLPSERYKKLVGRGLDLLIRRVLSGKNRPPGIIRRLAEEFGKQYRLHLTDTTSAYPGIPELLDQLAVRNIPMAVMSNKPHEMTVEIVSRLLSARPFRIVLGAGNGFPLKPDPAGALFIARELGSHPEHILFVGDSETDLATAVNAGMFPLAVTWGFRTRRELRQSGARSFVSRPDRILDMV
jgi:phosphoglycolate phosphatase